MINYVPALRPAPRAARLRWRVFSLCALLLLTFGAAAHGEEPWQASFEQTCSRTSEAMTLSVAELETLLQKCRDLEKVIETQEESVRKVYLKRLQLCKNLYAYVVEYKKGGEGAK
jgi:C4-dicarboxylate-specific signal transduction histidine kinase